MNDTTERMQRLLYSDDARTRFCAEQYFRARGEREAAQQEHDERQQEQRVEFYRRYGFMPEDLPEGADLKDYEPAEDGDR